MTQILKSNRSLFVHVLVLSVCMMSLSPACKIWPFYQWTECSVLPKYSVLPECSVLWKSSVLPECSVLWKNSVLRKSSVLQKNQ